MKYYVTQAGALFLEAVSKKLIGDKWLTPEQQAVASKPFGHGVSRTRRPTPSMVLRSPAPGEPKEWMKKPTKGSK